MSIKTCITIARQYGSGGREVGMRVSELLGLKLYDRELITMAAQKSGLSNEVLTHADEKATNSFLYSVAIGASPYGSAPYRNQVPINDKLFIAQSDIIRSAAEESGCVIIGRCSDYILRRNPDRLSVFIYAPIEERVKRLLCRHPDLETEKKAVDLARRTDKKRMNYYNFYTGRKWGDPENYHLMIDSSAVGIEGAARLIADAVRAKENK